MSMRRSCRRVISEIREVSTELYRLVEDLLERYPALGNHLPFFQLLLMFVDNLPKGSTEIRLSLADISPCGTEATFAVNALCSSTKIEARLNGYLVRFDWPCGRVADQMAALEQDRERAHTRKNKGGAHMDQAVEFVRCLCVAYTRVLDLRPARATHTLEAMNAQA